MLDELPLDLALLLERGANRVYVRQDSGPNTASRFTGQSLRQVGLFGAFLGLRRRLG